MTRPPVVIEEVDLTALSPPPVHQGYTPPIEPEPRRFRLIPRSRRGKVALAGGLVVILVAGLLGTTYGAPPGGTLWGLAKTVFPAHTQDVALTAVVDDLKKAQDILGSGQQPTPDQLTDARTALNQAKQGLDYVSPSDERTSLQNLYLQLTQQLLQYTPDSVQQLTALPAPPPPPAADPADPQAAELALMSGSAPTWGYDAPEDFGPPPPGVPDSPVADWPQPIDPPLTPNLANLGYYDPSWGQLYGYNPNYWYNYDLGGYNQYGYDFIGYDRWGYDRWGYDRWGYNRWGYNWAGYNWAGYDRHGWDRNGCNEWGQHRDRPWEPRNQRWYDRHHPYQQYYEWKFRIHNPVYRRAQWDHAHGFNPDRYRDWNRNRDWHNPRKRDWAPPAISVRADVKISVSSPVVKLNASLAQFISNDKATHSSKELMKDLSDKSARDFARDLTPRAHSAIGWEPLSTLGQQPDKPKSDRPDRQKSLAPTELAEPKFAAPKLAAPAPDAPPSKVSPEFKAPKIAPVPEYTPSTDDKPRDKPGRRTPAPEADPNPKGDTPNPAAVPPGEPEPASPRNPAAEHPRDVPGPRQADPVPQDPASEAQPPAEAPRHQEPPQQRTAPEESPAQRDPAPKNQGPDREAPVWQEPAPVQEAPKEAPAPKQQAPKQQAPEPQAPVWQEPSHEAPRQEVPRQEAPRQREQPQWEPPARQQPQWEPPARQAPAREAPRQAPQQRSEPAAPKAPKGGSKCPPPMCSGHG